MDMTYQLNPLVNAQKNFNVMETRLFYLGLQDINPHLTNKDKYFDEEFPDTLITPAQLKEIFGHGQYLKEVKKACRKLIGTSIEINYEDGFDLFTVFQHLKYKEKIGLHIKFNEDMRPFILDIYKGFKKYGFTKIEMQQIFVLESAYAMRILELMLQYNGKKKGGIIKRKVEIEELRKRLSVPVDSYKRMKDFRKKVLDLPISEIERKTKYTITYETIKEGRKIVAIEFSCNCNAVQADDRYTETIEAESYEEKLEEAGQVKLIEENKEKDDTLKKLKRNRYNKKTIQILLDACGGSWEELKNRLDYAEKRAQEDKPNKPGGFIKTGILEDWLGQARAEEQAQARELEASQINAEWELWALQQGKDEPAPKKPEVELDMNSTMNRAIIKNIKKELLERNLTITSKNILADLGLTVSRFVEKYMKG